MPSESDPPLSPSFARFCVRVEKYVLPLIYGVLACQRLYDLLVTLPDAYHRQVLSPRSFPHAGEIHFAVMVKYALLCALMVFVGLALLGNRPPRELPDRLSQVAVPMIASFYFLLYGAVDTLPDFLRFNLFPETLQPAFALAGLGLSVLGYAVSLWALWHLRRSFALLVSVRDVVTGGPYRYVRHPIYLGYFLDQGGLVLASGSLAMVLLGVGFVMFQVHRAKLEETKLGEAKLEYRRYAQRTGFILPRWRW